MWGKQLSLAVFVFSLFSCVFFVPLSAATVTWNEKYVGTEAYMGVSSPTYDAGCMINTNDGGFAITGYKYDMGGVQYTILLFKIDSTGNISWLKTFSLGQYNIAYSLIQTIDGGFAIAGVTKTMARVPFWYNAFLIKTDSEGNMQWNKTIGGLRGSSGTGPDYDNTDYSAKSVIQTADGSFILACNAGYLVKIGPLGNLLWNKSYTGIFNSLIQTNDGGYAVAGSYLLKTDSSGNSIWNRTIGGANKGIIYSLTKTLDGGFALAGSAGSAAWLAKTDSIGSLEWDKTYGSVNSSSFSSIIQTNDNGFAMAGSWDNKTLVKTDSLGNMQWTQSYGRNDACSIVKTIDGGYAISGGEFWLVKTDSSGNAPMPAPISTATPTPASTVTPAPSQSPIAVLSPTSIPSITPSPSSSPSNSVEDTNNDWPMFLHDPQHTGYSESKAPDTNTVLWKRNLTGYLSPVISNGRAIVVSNSGHLSSLNSTNGNEIWTTALGTGLNSVEATPAISAGRIFIGARDNTFYCLNESTGILLWSFPTAGLTGPSSAIIVNDRVFFVADTTLYSLNISDGTLLWSRQTWGLSLSPTYADGMIFSGYQTIYAVNSVSGNISWEFNVDSSYPKSTIVASDGKVFFSTGNSSVYCVNAHSGALLWSSKLGGQLSMSSPVLANGKLFVGSDNGYVYCLDASTGALEWKYETSGMIARLAVADGKVFIGSSDGKIHVINENNGTLLWSYYIGNPRFPVVYGGKVFISGETGIYAFGPKQILPTALSLSISSQSSVLGFQINLNGDLTISGAGVANVPIRLTYSVNGGITWADITLVKTLYDGSYTAVWVPSATGTYIVKATWVGNDTIEPVEVVRMLSVTSFNDQYVFSVTSNSTVSTLFFNSNNSELRFTVSGPSGTTGYVKATIAKNLLANSDGFKVYLDGNQLNYSIVSTDSSWVLTFNYIHSTHQVNIIFASNMVASSFVIPEWLWIVTVAIAVIAVVGSVVLLRKKRVKD